jgi:ATP-binding cassette subfamily B protein
MTLGTLLSVTYILGQLSGPVQSIVSFIRDTQDAKIAQLRVDDVYLEKEENEGTKIIAPAQINSLQIEKLNFKYPGSFNPFVLNNITFSIPINKITAIVGQSGSGKTTLLKLLLAYYNSNAGEININEINIKDIDTETWRKKCGIVMQDGHIFSSTIAENIALSDKIINPEKVKKAAKIACIDSFIETLPMGYNTKIGNTGIHLSGGQKQRLLIARTVYRDPEFIFFDEATNSLDAANEKMIMENLEQFFIGRTVIVVAHRLSTVKNADQIIVLDKGNVTEIGKHKELCELQGVYFNLVKNQLELGNE